MHFWRFESPATSLIEGASCGLSFDLLMAEIHSVCYVCLFRGCDMDPLGLKFILISFIIFVPLDRLFAFHPEQRVFRRGWANDLIFLFLNGLVIKLGLFIVIGG